uniref:Zinc finger protein 280C n=1 Tax=Aceria tosichella TaxID=561515 RepID=A0A6G1SI84_9ACAR
MSRDSSPPPMSDDSAIGSLAGSGTSARVNNHTGGAHVNINGQSNGERSQTIANNTSNNNDNNNSTSSRSQYSNQDTENHDNNEPEGLVKPEELRLASKQMRYKNTTLLSRSIRTNLSCFDDLDTQRMDYNSDFLVNFISIGINKSPFSIQRPVSILWPDNYDKMIDELSKLDAYLINTEFKEKPIDWMLNKGLTSIPECKSCKQPMTLKYERTNVAWRCNRTQVCQNLYAPIQRPIFFKGYESVGLMKILFSIYYWSICTQCDLLYSHLKIEPKTLHGIWQSIQNVCRVALEKSYPRFRLCNNPNSDENQSNSQIKASSEIIDLISIKFNNYYIVCAKHPRSNHVRLGLYVPKVSRYSFADLTDSWFAHGAEIRVCENKFLDLMKKRTDLQVKLVTRPEMVVKDGAFHRQSAFGYLICQLSHIFKDFDSSQVSLETLKLILAEIEWRELYGTNPYDAFTKIVEHMALYRGASDCYFEPVIIDGELGSEIDIYQRDQSEFVFAEKYFYSLMQPVDSHGKVIQKYGNREDNGDVPAPIVQFRCHICTYQYESFYFSMHMVAHVEHNRKDNEQAEFLRTKQIKCKHCFKKFNKEGVVEHAQLFRADLHTIQFGCRICCLKFGDRAKYLEHMRRTHFEHEMPYRCPSCKFGSSFQRELVIHFQEEHQTEFVILCPFCLRGWTIAEPEKLDRKRMDAVSQTLYNHILEHYALADSFSCDKCCLSFLDRRKLERHKALHHNPSEIFPEKEVKLEPFIVTRAEEEFCVMALQMEFFIPNKRPNLAIDEASQAAASSAGLIHSDTDIRRAPKKPRTKNNGASTSRDNVDDSSDSSADSDDSENYQFEDCLNSIESDTIHVRASSNARRFLNNGTGAIQLHKSRGGQNDLTTEKILEFMSRLKRADCVIPNQSVILTPTGRPAKCVECSEYITVDHYVAAITCKPCHYTTHCPIAATKHKQSRHANTN